MKLFGKIVSTFGTKKTPSRSNSFSDKDITSIYTQTTASGVKKIVMYLEKQFEDSRDLFQTKGDNGDIDKIVNLILKDDIREDFLDSITDINSIVTALQIILSTHDPLIPFIYYDLFMAPDSDFHHLLNKLSPTNYNLLTYFISFFNKILNLKRNKIDIKYAIQRLGLYILRPKSQGTSLIDNSDREIDHRISVFLQMIQQANNNSAQNSSRLNESHHDSDTTSLNTEPVTIQDRSVKVTFLNPMNRPTQDSLRNALSQYGTIANIGFKEKFAVILFADYTSAIRCANERNGQCLGPDFKLKYLGNKELDYSFQKPETEKEENTTNKLNTSVVKISSSKPPIHPNHEVPSGLHPSGLNDTMDSMKKSAPIPDNPDNNKSNISNAKNNITSVNALGPQPNGDDSFRGHNSKNSQDQSHFMGQIDLSAISKNDMDDMSRLSISTMTDTSVIHHQTKGGSNNPQGNLTLNENQIQKGKNQSGPSNGIATNISASKTFFLSDDSSMESSLNHKSRHFGDDRNTESDFENKQILLNKSQALNHNGVQSLNPYITNASNEANSPKPVSGGGWKSAQVVKSPTKPPNSTKDENGWDNSKLLRPTEEEEEELIRQNENEDFDEFSGNGLPVNISLSRPIVLPSPEKPIQKSNLVIDPNIVNDKEDIPHSQFDSPQKKESDNLSPQLSPNTITKKRQVKKIHVGSPNEIHRTESLDAESMKAVEDEDDVIIESVNSVDKVNFEGFRQNEILEIEPKGSSPERPKTKPKSKKPIVPKKSIYSDNSEEEIDHKRQVRKVKHDKQYPEPSIQPQIGSFFPMNSTWRKDTPKVQELVHQMQFLQAKCLQLQEQVDSLQGQDNFQKQLFEQKMIEYEVRYQEKQQENEKLHQQIQYLQLELSSFKASLLSKELKEQTLENKQEDQERKSLYVIMTQQKLIESLEKQQQEMKHQINQLQKTNSELHQENQDFLQDQLQYSLVPHNVGINKANPPQYLKDFSKEDLSINNPANLLEEISKDHENRYLDFHKADLLTETSKSKDITDDLGPKEIIEKIDPFVSLSKSSLNDKPLSSYPPQPPPTSPYLSPNPAPNLSMTISNAPKSPSPGQKPEPPQGLIQSKAISKDQFYDLKQLNDIRVKTFLKEAPSDLRIYTNQASIGSTTLSSSKAFNAKGSTDFNSSLKPIKPSSSMDQEPKSVQEKFEKIAREYEPHHTLTPKYSEQLLDRAFLSRQPYRSAIHSSRLRLDPNTPTHIPTSQSKFPYSMTSKFHGQRTEHTLKAAEDVTAIRNYLAELKQLSPEQQQQQQQHSNNISYFSDLRNHVQKSQSEMESDWLLYNRKHSNSLPVNLNKDRVEPPSPQVSSSSIPDIPDYAILQYHRNYRQ